ncbi:DUF742 domain-containing protein [Streptomyces yaizuensis]|uniref:DUF742 domain-containing protein n=1 Tax=Streptomyces yaizuensis TaxID=2989713 RepID=A0ABQ5NXT4_9ACTN|nr:DUF742 domain-containing protein [Streptomyces sp. YSPA8]GLF95176.1 DUF742 domain-containing protein [Streptomyces sp. YSPA8]
MTPHPPPPEAAPEARTIRSLRPYAVTGGRTRPVCDLRRETLLGTGLRVLAAGALPEHREAVRLCEPGPRAVAELAALLQLPVQAAKVVLADLVHSGRLHIASPPLAERPSRPLLERVARGLRAL